MAACGIAEHNEARRKEVVYNRKAFYQLQREEMTRRHKHYDILDQSLNRYPTTYDLQVDHLRQRGLIGNVTDHTSGYKDDYMTYYKKQNNDFTPRPPQRSSNIDYLSQW